MKITKSQLKHIVEEEVGFYLAEKKTFSSWRQAIKADAELGSMDDIVSVGDLGDHGRALDKSEREQVAAGADPEDIKVPHMKRKEYIKAAKRKKAREARKKAREQRKVIEEITKSQLKQIIKEEFGNVMAEQPNDVKQLIEQGRSFFDQVIQLSMASEDDPEAQEKLNQVEEALSREVHEKSHGWVKFNIVG